GTPATVRAQIHRGAAASVMGRFTSNPGLEHVRLPANENLDSALAYYASRADVQFVQKNFIYHTLETSPNDTLFANQWALKNTLSTGNPLASVNATFAWDKTTGRFNVIVAVVDTGVDYTHGDLGLNIWTNPAEAGLNCTNGIDDDPQNNVDGFVFVDDCRGWNFFDFNNNPMDVTGHGTEMAGIIGALGNDTLGIAGANWNIQIMPLRVSDTNGNISSATAAQAIDYAVKHGASVINASWGGNNAGDATLLAAINNAGTAGVLFVTAAGNQSSNNDSLAFYPCNYSTVASNVICAAATDENDNLAFSSNFGANSVQLGAPGNNIQSTGLNQGYPTDSGTSQAAAYVSGGAALLKGCKAALTSSSIKSILLLNTRPILALTGNTTTGGVVNFEMAVDDASVGACDAVAVTSSPVANPGGPYNSNIKKAIQFDGSGSTDSNGQLLIYFWSFGDGTFGVGVKPTHTYTSRGAFTATLFVRDNQGAIASQCTTVTVRPNNGH
ncbi:MAG TPA: S8 family serine peptidase, partial [Terriglobia bacterium]|nr:S8 family serine peptidase [Terriglobia bacterium]